MLDIIYLFTCLYKWNLMVERQQIKKLEDNITLLLQLICFQIKLFRIFLLYYCFKQQTFGEAESCSLWFISSTLCKNACSFNVGTHFRKCYRFLNFFEIKVMTLGFIFVLCNDEKREKSDRKNTWEKFVIGN